MALWTFDRFVPGQKIGSYKVALDQPFLKEWLAIFPDDAALTPLMPPGMAMAVIMRSYMNIMPERVPGNVHAGQSLRITELPVVGDELVTKLSCASAEERKGRYWVGLRADVVSMSNRPMFGGDINMLWAKEAGES